MTHLRITILPDRFAVCRFPPQAPVPDWIRGAFTSITRTADELSIVCDDEAVPDGVQVERTFRAVKVEGPIPFEVTGVAAALVSPLAAKRISVFLVATFDTDYLLVKDAAFDEAVAVLREAGHDVN